MSNGAAERTTTTSSRKQADMAAAVSTEQLLPALPVSPGTPQEQHLPHTNGNATDKPRAIGRKSASSASPRKRAKLTHNQTESLTDRLDDLAPPPTQAHRSLSSSRSSQSGSSMDISPPWSPHAVGEPNSDQSMHDDDDLFPSSGSSSTRTPPKPPDEHLVPDPALQEPEQSPQSIEQTSMRAAAQSARKSAGPRPPRPLHPVGSSSSKPTSPAAAPAPPHRSPSLQQPVTARKSAAGRPPRQQHQMRFTPGGRRIFGPDVLTNTDDSMDESVDQAGTRPSSPPLPNEPVAEPGIPTGGPVPSVKLKDWIDSHRKPAPAKPDSLSDKDRIPFFLAYLPEATILQPSSGGEHVDAEPLSTFGSSDSGSSDSDSDMLGPSASQLSASNAKGHSRRPSQAHDAPESAAEARRERRRRRREMMTKARQGPPTTMPGKLYWSDFALTPGPHNDPADVTSSGKHFLPDSHPRNFPCAPLLDRPRSAQRLPVAPFSRVVIQDSQQQQHQLVSENDVGSEMERWPPFIVPWSWTSLANLGKDRSLPVAFPFPDAFFMYPPSAAHPPVDALPDVDDETRALEPVDPMFTDEEDDVELIARVRRETEQGRLAYNAEDAEMVGTFAGLLVSLGMSKPEALDYVDAEARRDGARLRLPRAASTTSATVPSSAGGAASGGGSGLANGLQARANTAAAPMTGRKSAARRTTTTSHSKANDGAAIAEGKESIVDV